MTRPSDLHLDLVGPESYGLARSALEVVQKLDVEHVLGGGWAVYAHTAEIPSVDVDLFLPLGVGERLSEGLEERGLAVGPGGEVELLGLDAEIELWGFGEPDLGIPHPSYTPREAFEGRTVETELALPEDPIDVTVPTPPALAATKVVAMGNRGLAYRSYHDGQARMSLGPALVPRLHRRAQSYYLRKAGKDLFDLALLLREDSGRTRELLAGLGLVEEAGQIAGTVDPAVSEMADDLAERAGTSSPLQVVQDALG